MPDQARVCSDHWLWGHDSVGWRETESLFLLHYRGHVDDFSPMRQVPLERDINIAVNGPFLMEVANQEWAIYGNVDITL